MRARARLLAHAVTFDMTPMIDVVFLLLIFFMMASQLTSLQSAGEVTLPQAHEARLPARVDRYRLTVTILPSGAYVVAGDNLSLTELRSVLRQEAEAARAASRPPPSVHVRADQGAPYRSLRLVMRECVTLGIRRLSFAAQPPPGETLELEEG